MIDLRKRFNLPLENLESKKFEQEKFNKDENNRKINDSSEKMNRQFQILIKILLIEYVTMTITIDAYIIYNILK